MALASYFFLLAFLPAALVLFRAAGRRFGPRGAAGALCAASLAFCGWGSRTSLVLLLGSGVFNYALGRLLARRADDAAAGRGLLALGVAANLLLLGYFKYAGFFAENWNALTGGDVAVAKLLLPLGVSFFSFQQIAYLVDARRGAAGGEHWLDYALFVSFFPKLVAGPIADASTLIPQFSRPSFGCPSERDLAIGLTLLAAGLCKKVLIADELGECADPLFAAPAQGLSLSSLAAWLGALAYTLQMYFDFSGYSDMALGAARCFGVVLPLNFYSPYQATSIIAFWRRWHMSLTRFLTRYLYTPLATGLTRWAIGRGTGRLALFFWTVALPTLVTFALAGLWHGAGWTFVLFGVLHGVYLTANHGWRELRRRWFGRPAPSRLRALGSWALTFAAVSIALVVFRAANLADARALLAAMLGMNGWTDLGLGTPREVIERRDLLLLAPNTLQLLRRFEPALDMPRGEPEPRWTLHWEPRPWLAGVCAFLLIVSLVSLGKVGGFIYYNF